jgi:hypothetical protein
MENDHLPFVMSAVGAGARYFPGAKGDYLSTHYFLLAVRGKLDDRTG